MYANQPVPVYNVSIALHVVLCAGTSLRNPFTDAELCVRAGDHPSKGWIGETFPSLHIFSTKV